MKRLLSLGFAAFALIAASLFSTAPAFADGLGTKTEVQGGVTCTTWKLTTPNYPGDDAHYWVCVSPQHPTFDFAKADSIAIMVSGWTGTGMRTYFQNHNIKYYYFQTRADTAAFMNAKFGMNVGKLASTTARCGNTGTDGLVTTIISEVYANCEYGGTLGSGLNPNETKVAAHESGHAFDIAFATDHGGTLLSLSPGFKALAGGSTTTSPPYVGDIAAMTPCNWTNGNSCNPHATTMTPTQQAALVCNFFKPQLFPSLLEQSLAVPNDAVCSNSTTINSQYAGMTPTVIGQTKRAPYFIGTGVSGSAPLYEELFAEQFSNQVTGVGGTNPLQVTDFTLSSFGGSPCSTVNGVYTCQSPPTNASGFFCTGWVLREVWFTQNPPPAFPNSLSLKARGCPDIAPGQFN